MKSGSTRLIFAWGIAFGITLAVSLMVPKIVQRELSERFAGLASDFADSDAVFLGSSLTRFALPKHGTAAPIAGINANRALRVGLSHGTEAELLDLAQVATGAGPRAVFIEVNPLVSRFATAPSYCHQSLNLFDMHKRLQDSVRTLFPGHDFMRGALQDAKYARHMDQNIANIKGNYPLQFVGPCDLTSWENLVDGTPKQTKIILVSMPRAALAKTLVGAADMAEFEARVQLFANALDLPLFAPDKSETWGAEYFVDQAHLSLLGSDRFRQELAKWWSAQQ